MNRHQFLRQLHARARPRNYLEIGVSTGKSLTLSRVPSIGVDPAFRVTEPLRCDLHLVKATSDDFFASRDPIAHFRSGRNPLRNLRRGRAPFGHYIGGGPVVDLAFIDGLHWFEVALRDFINVERFSGWTTLIVMDDVLPLSGEDAARKQKKGMWNGDVFKVIDILREHRPDLVILPIDTQPTGVAVILGADPHSDVLKGRYERIIADWSSPDPQVVPAHVLERRGAVAPERFLESPILQHLLAGRRRPRSRDGGYRKMLEEAARLTA